MGSGQLDALARTRRLRAGLRTASPSSSTWAKKTRRTASELFIVLTEKRPSGTSSAT
jgi:hypothetical protein